MGVVYKAQDTKLDRLVALKFLPHRVAVSADEKARFIQEAKAAAGLNHPNICTIHGIEEHDGQQFIEMEYVDGVTLREKIGAIDLQPALKMNDAISYAIQIGEALQEAHSKGIVHRDVKAENIMVNAKNQVKVMDFGLAKLGVLGVVYKAQDTKLDRLVALKFLPHRVAVSADEKARFIQEAKAAAGLNHPNICTIHGIEEHDGQQFIEMEYVDGVTMREKIAGADRRTALQVNNAISYAIQIGEALQEAHSKGIVHRDVKAENIMVNAKNQIKVMDFGLAKLKGSLKLTRTSSTVGTLAYMAPEQIQGGEVDARSDIFSFGVVLFEMLTGQMPFRGEHEAATMYSIVNEEPQSCSLISYS